MSTLAFIGCGNMGSAILSGLLDATRSEPQTAKITHFNISTKSAASASNLRTTYSADASRLTITHGANVRAMQEADIIMLACKPFLAQDILSQPGVAGALLGKFVISIMAGKSAAEISELIYAGSGSGVAEDKKPVIVTAMPNVAARLRQSMTIVEENAALSAERAEILQWIFGQIGRVKYVAPEMVDAGSMVSGAAMALVSLAVDGILDGAVMEGFRRGEALEVSAQVLEGLAGLLREGVHPAVLRESISSPRGCTIQGLYALEKNGVRGAYAEALVRGTKHLRGEKE
ncbi:delta 1-pyrroline-5-carboxylate reductase [Aspergillus alliaceus]|uniref:Delta 1-pyrroline-5-carboxylate reductase n=1 Tax=Petromyces alliaceus TaxID=209559 RepID=A0A5N6FJU8_PETAA|nr:pyrroline-5-carboxylate reductase dimerization-domain-containing protein [Aspergillus alliaceus]KAB8228924.1 pyrroline-5-carboxylate reductase dimerization-domain-containing protein [Aspergillus alliaceus]KAF5856675.1 delta 1-pyrroline-5-carboxylate reductase [Aspergillus burnettii]